MKKKKKLLVLLGAGSSVEQKVNRISGFPYIPSVAVLDAAMKTWSQELADEYNRASLGRAASLRPAVFRRIFELLEQYDQKASKPVHQLGVNFERVLAELVALDAAIQDPPLGSPWFDQIDPSSSWLRREFAVAPGFLRGILADEFAMLVKRMALVFRQCCARLDTRTPQFQGYADLFRSLRKHFDIGVYSLNYDDVVLQAAPGLYRGFNKHREFDPRAVIARERWNFLYQLHGSADWTFKKSSNPFESTIVLAEPGIKAGDFRPVLTSRSPDTADGGKRFPPTTMIAGGFKREQLEREPFQTLSWTFSRHVWEADALLIGGYGWGDTHINKVLTRRFANSGRAKRPPAVVLSFGNIDKHGICHRDPTAFSMGEKWTWDMEHTMNVAAGDFGTSPPMDLTALVNHNALEQNKSAGVAIWWGGFSTAVRAESAILKWLAGAV